MSKRGEKGLGNESRSREWRAGHGEWGFESVSKSICEIFFHLKGNGIESNFCIILTRFLIFLSAFCCSSPPLFSLFSNQTVDCSPRLYRFIVWSCYCLFGLDFKHPSRVWLSRIGKKYVIYTNLLISVGWQWWAWASMGWQSQFQSIW